MNKTIIKINLFAILLAAVVVILGAYTRLTDAGLGCPDWPGCYGFLSVPQHVDDIAHAETLFPDRPVEAHKAWNEMVHRYFAGTLGLVILIMFIIAHKEKQFTVIPTLLLVLVIFQAALGMWTVTMNLMPLVVMGHLLGGFTIFCLLVVNLRQMQSRENGGIISPPSSECYSYSKFASFAFVVLIIQIALGGWTAANYAAVACTQLPICEGDWVQRLDFSHAFSIPTGHESYEYGVFPYEARMTIHVTHRIWALVTVCSLLILAWKLMQSKSDYLKRFAVGLVGLTSLQFVLGISNVVFNLPLGVAVAHNFIALCLLSVLVSLMFNLRTQKSAQATFNTWIKE